MTSLPLLVLSLLTTGSAPTLSYPATRTVDATDTYFGKTYKDPYRWLEDLKAKDTEAWFKAQATLTDELLAKIPARDALVKEWEALDKLKPASYSDFQLEGGRLFYKKTLGGENVGKLYARDGWTGPEKLVFDPASYKGTHLPQGPVTINGINVSWDGKHAGLSLTAGGSEWSEVRILDVATGALLPEVIYPSQGVSSWTEDGKSFIYDFGKVTDLKSPDIQQHRQQRFHTLGTPMTQDRDVLSDESHPELGIEAKEWPSASISELLPKYLVGMAGTVQNEQRLFVAPVADLGKPKVGWKKVAEHSDNLVRSFGFYGDKVYAITHSGAPRYKLVRTRLDHPDWAHAETVLPEAADSLRYFDTSKDDLMLVYSNGAVGRLVKYDTRTNKASDVPLPLSGTVFVQCPDAHSNHCLVFVTSWTQPVAIYDLDGDSGKLSPSVFNADVKYPGFDTLVSEEVEVPGQDGTPVPLSIIHQKGLALDGSHSCILEGYGAYGIPIEPYFSILHSVAKRGVVLALAHVRGGGEKGEAWYKAGYKATKPNTWKDFISAAKYLIDKKYTSAGRLAGTGTSAGGILITRAITERPDLFAAAVCNVGCANAMRMEFSPNGPINTPEFGTVKDQTEAAALYEMDGVQHVQKGTKYPAVMGVGGWNDPRVAPWEPGKFVAAVQAASTSGKPVLMKVNYDDGHFTEDKSVTFRNFASQYAFLLWQTGHPEFQPAK